MIRVFNVDLYCAKVIVLDGVVLKIVLQEDYIRAVNLVD
jgi:hypothetical protein